MGYLLGRAGFRGKSNMSVAITILLGTALGQAEGTPVEGSPHFDLEELYRDGRHEEGLARSSVRLRYSFEDAHLLWQRVRFMDALAQAGARGPDRVAHYEEMMRLAREAVRVAPEDPLARYWRGVAGYRLAVSQGAPVGPLVRQDFEAVARHPTLVYRSLDGRQQLPCDAWRHLGEIHRLQADERISRGSQRTRKALERSLEFHQRAVACASASIQSLKELAATQLCLADQHDQPALRDEGLATLERALALPSSNAADAIDLEHVRQLRAEPGKACWYRREATATAG